MNKEEMFHNVFQHFLSFRAFMQEYAYNSDPSEKQIVEFLVREEDLTETLKYYLINFCPDLHINALMLHPSVSELSEEDQEFFYHYLCKSLSTTKNANGSYEMIKFVPLSYWNDDEKQEPILVNAPNNNRLELIKKELSSNINEFLSGQLLDGVSIEVLNAVSPESMRFAIRDGNIQDIYGVLTDLPADKRNSSWYRNTLFPVVLKSDTYRNLYALNEMFNISDVYANYAGQYKDRKMYAEVSYFGDILEINERVKFYFWLNSILATPVKLEAESDTDIVSRDGFIHCVISEEDLIVSLDVSIDLMLGSGEVRTVKAKKIVYSDNEIAEISSFWASRSSPYDSFTFTFGSENHIEDEHDVQYNAIFLMPSNIVVH